eukprot:snap_masked-scaffold_30-processed-gene-2.60-mRNA-1 protein AED:1.00 eAED:1.00 QI:0/-1/0/0/-1/1/1/0/257
MRNFQGSYSYQEQYPSAFPPFNHTRFYNPVFDQDLNRENGELWKKESFPRADGRSLSGISRFTSSAYRVGGGARKKDKAKRKICSLCDCKGKKKWFCCCFFLLLVFAAFLFPRSPDFTPDLNNLNIDGVDLSEAGFLKLSFPLSFQNVNFLPLTIFEFKVQVDFGSFLIDVKLEDKIELDIKGEGNGTALLFLNFSNTIGALGPILEQCTVDLIDDIDPLIGVLSGDALGKYLDIELSTPIHASNFTLGCPLADGEE